MDKRTRKIAKVALTAASLVWLAANGVAAVFFMPANEVLTMNSPQVQDRLRDDCNGSFQQRYQCKEDILVAIDRRTFGFLSLRVILAVAGPAFAAFAYRRWCRPDPDEPVWTPPDVLAPSDRASDDSRPDEDEGGRRAAPPPPDDDWKARARSRVVHARLPEDPEGG